MVKVIIIKSGLMKPITKLRPGMNIGLIKWIQMS